MFLIYELVYQNNHEVVNKEFKKYEEQFKDEMFEELMSTLEARQCALAMFASKFEKLDIHWLNMMDVF